MRLGKYSWVACEAQRPAALRSVTNRTAVEGSSSVFVSVDGLSCPSAHACVAVGTYAVGGGARFPLVERYG